jgi:hypothetical protein
MTSRSKDAPTITGAEGEPVKKKNTTMLWIKRLGVAGFIFFLAKGILWLTVGAALLRVFGCER